MFFRKIPDSHATEKFQNIIDDGWGEIVPFFSEAARWD
jgi:hypothetical protein